MTTLTAISCLLLCSANAPARAPRHPDAVSVFSCEFDQAGWDANFDQWPDNWTRRKSEKHPHFLPIAVVEDARATKGHALKIQLDGGAGEVLSPPIPVDASFSYVLEGRVKTEGLIHDRAYLCVKFYNARQELLETVSTEAIGGSVDWMDCRGVHPPATRWRRPSSHCG